MEVWPLDGKVGDGAGTGLGSDAFPGNNLGRLEFTPEARVPVGRPADLDARPQEVRPDRRARDRRDRARRGQEALRAVALDPRHRARRASRAARARWRTSSPRTPRARPTEPVVPDERRGRRADVRATCSRRRSSTSPTRTPTAGAAARVSEGGVFFQRYNGNGVDLNRDWPDIGFSFRPYSGLSEPETRALSRLLRRRRATNDGAVRRRRRPARPAVRRRALVHAAAARPARLRARTLRIRETAKTIHRARPRRCSGRRSSSPTTRRRAAACRARRHARRQPAPRSTARPGARSTTRSTTRRPARSGDWFDSSVGLGADGIDNEMSFSHLDKNIVFDPHTEQLHVDGNKALIYAHLAELLEPGDRHVRRAGRARATCRTRAWCARSRCSSPTRRQAHRAAGRHPRPARHRRPGRRRTTSSRSRSSARAGERTPGIYNGGMRVDVTTTERQGIGTGRRSTLKRAVQGLRRAPRRRREDDEWVTVAEDFNQSLALRAGGRHRRGQPAAGAQGGRHAGRVARRGRPGGRRDHADGHRLHLGPGDDATARRAATTRRCCSGYDVANTDFFRDLNKHVPSAGEAFSARRPARR